MRPSAARGTSSRPRGPRGRSGWFHGAVCEATGRCTEAGSTQGVEPLEQAGVDSNEHGWVLVDRAQSGSDLDLQKRLYEEAVGRCRRRCRDGDLECEALASLGIMLAFSGSVAEGMARLDEALAAICAGEVEDLSVVEGVFCGLFNACERTNDVGRAEQWLRAADDYVRRRRFAAVGGYCRGLLRRDLTRCRRVAEAEAELTCRVDRVPARPRPDPWERAVQTGEPEAAPGPPGGGS